MRITETEQADKLIHTHGDKAVDVVNTVIDDLSYSNCCWALRKYWLDKRLVT